MWGKRATAQSRRDTRYGVLPIVLLPRRKGRPQDCLSRMRDVGIDARRPGEPLPTQAGFLITQQVVSIGHDPLPSCAASADASQLNMLLYQCRILRKERRHREQAGPVGNQEMSCLPLGPCKCPLTTGSGRQAGRLGSLFPGTDWAVGRAYTSRPPPPPLSIQ